MLDFYGPVVGLVAAVVQLAFGLVFLAVRLAGAALGVVGEVAWLLLAWAARNPALAVVTAVAVLVTVAVVL